MPYRLGEKAILWAVLLFCISITVCIWSFAKGRSNMGATGSSGQEIFVRNCAGCHSGGKNIFRTDKPVIGSKRLANKDTFKEFLIRPTGDMSPFPSIAKRDTDLNALYVYCKSLK